MYDYTALHLIRRKIRAATRVVAAVIFLLVAVSLVPSDEAYYRAEQLLSYLGPLGPASQHVRSVPATANSLLMEPFQGNSLEVEGVRINLRYADNPTEQVEEVRFFSQVLGEDRTYWIYLPPGYQGGTLKKCVNSQAVYPLSEQHGLEAQERR